MSVFSEMGLGMPYISFVSFVSRTILLTHTAMNDTTTTTIGIIFVVIITVAGLVAVICALAKRNSSPPPSSHPRPWRWVKIRRKNGDIVLEKRFRKRDLEAGQPPRPKPKPARNTAPAAAAPDVPRHPSIQLPIDAHPSMRDDFDIQNLMMESVRRP
jgi:hypothetical protein